MVLPLPPHTDDKDMDYWTQAVTEAIREGTAASSAEFLTGQDDQGRPTIGMVSLGYQERYLHVRYSSSADGTENFTNDYTQITGLSIYQGLRNSPSTTESEIPAAYTWRQISFVTGWMPTYRTVGGRQIDWMFIASLPTGFTLDDGSHVIDLDSLPGAVGADGNTQGTITIFQRSDSAPETPAATTDYDTSDGSFTNPSGWSTTIPTGAARLYSSTANIFGAGTLTANWQTPIVAQGVDGETGPGGTASRLDIAYFSVPTGIGTANYPSGTLAGGDYTPANRGDFNYQGTNVVTWVADSTEPAPSTTRSDYEINQLTGDEGVTGLSNRVDFAYANTSTGQAGFSTSYFTDALYVGTDVVTYTAGTTPPTQSLTPSDYEWSRLRGEDGDNGLDGFNTAVKSVYIRQEAEPTTAPTETLTYTFSTASGIFPGSTQTSNGWSVFVPSGTDQLWERRATAVSRTDTDTIAPADWSGAIQSGSTGADGQDGINTATVYLYQRNSSDTAPADPNQQTTYVFSSGAVSPTNNNGWTPTIPAQSNGTHLWVTFATAANRTSTDIIEASEFADPELLAVDGATGPDGPRGAGRWNVRVSSISANPTQATLTGYLRTALNDSTAEPIVGDQLWLFTSVSSTNLIPTDQDAWLYTDESGTAQWTRQDEVIRGDLIVGGTVTASEIAANTITASEIASDTITASEIASDTITASKIAADTITASEIAADTITATELAADSVTATQINVDNLAAISATLGNVNIDAARINTGTIDNARINGATITNLDADNINAGTLNADRIQIDGATLDTDAAGNLTVQTINGGGIVVGGDGLGVSIDGSSVILNDDGELEAPATTIPNTITTFGTGVSNRDFTSTVNRVFVSPNFIMDSQFFYWRATNSAVGLTAENINGIRVDNFDVNFSVARQVVTTTDLPAFTESFDIRVGFGTGTTTGIGSGASLTLDGQVRSTRNAVAFSQFSSGYEARTHSGQFSTLGSYIPISPASNQLVMFMQFRYRASLVDPNASGSIPTSASVTFTLPTQTDTVMRVRQEGGTETTYNFNDYFLFT